MADDYYGPYQELNETVLVCNESHFGPFECHFDLPNIPSEEFQLIYFLCYGIFGTFLIVFGLMGNSLIIVVFLRPKLWACQNYYLIVLAIWDSALLVSSFTQFSLWVLNDSKGAIRLHGDYQAYILRYAYICINTTMTGCIWMIVTVTIERYLAISSPLRHRTLNNSGRAKTSLIGVSMLAVFFNLSRALEVTVRVCCATGTVEFGVAVVGPTELSQSPVYFIFYRVFVGLFLVYLCPLIILTTLTTLMSIAIRQATLQRRHMSHGNIEPVTSSNGSRVSEPTSLIQTVRFRMRRSDRRRGSCANQVDSSVNKTLMAVLVKFLLCYSTPAALDLCGLLMPLDMYYSTWMEYVTIASNMLVIFNSSCNFAIYFISGKRFRAEIKYLLCRKPKLWRTSVEKCRWLPNDPSSQQSEVMSIRPNFCNNNKLSIVRYGAVQISSKEELSAATISAEIKVEETGQTEVKSSRRWCSNEHLISPRVSRDLRNELKSIDELNSTTERSRTQSCGSLRQGYSTFVQTLKGPFGSRKRKFVTFL